MDVVKKQVEETEKKKFFILICIYSTKKKAIWNLCVAYVDPWVGVSL